MGQRKRKKKRARVGVPARRAVRSGAAAARRGDENFRTLVENTQDVIARFDRQHRYLYINRAASSYVPLKPEEFIGKTHAELGFPEDRVRSWEATIEKVFVTGEPEDLELELDGVQGRLVFAWRVFPEVDEAGRVKTVVTVSRDITARKRAEDAVRVSELRYRRLFESAEDGILILDADTGRVLDVNPFVTDLLGFFREELLGRRLEETEPFKSVAGAEQMFSGLQPKGIVRQEHLQLQTRDGRSITVEVVSGVYRLDGETVIQCHIRDVSDRTRVEAALRASEARYRELFQRAPVGLLRSTPEGRILDANPAFLRMLDYPDLETLRQVATPDLYVDREDRRRFREAIDREGLVRDYEVEWRRRDGTPIWVRLTVRAVKDEAGRVVLYEGSEEDVTERKQAQEALRRSEAGFRSLVENAPLGICRCREAGTLLAVNPALVKMLGYESEAELLARNLTTDIHQEPAQRARILASRRAGLVGGIEVGWKRKDGTPITVRTTGRLLGDDTFELFVEDVTEQRQIEQQLRQVQKLDAVGQLAGGVAHDFNNLLTVILGRSRLLLKRLPADDPVRRQIATIEGAAVRAAGVTRQLLAFSRKQVMQPRVIDLGAVVAGLEPLLRRLIREDIELVLARGVDVGSVRADPVQVEQVLMNLVVNSRDAMPRGGRLTIEVANSDLDGTSATGHLGPPPGPYVRLTVQDTGIGMDAATRGRLFEPFFTTKAPGAGTGLGLATVYGIVKQSGGYIAVDSAPGEGTRVEILLPRVAPMATPGEPSAPSALSRGIETILLVEDEADLREFAREVLVEQGYTVLAARDGEDAVRLSDEHPGPIALVLTDVVMPRMGGREVAARVTAAHPDMKVLYMTGYSEESMIRRGPTEARAALLKKPFAPDVLVRTVREVLDART